MTVTHAIVLPKADQASPMTSAGVPTVRKPGRRFSRHRGTVRSLHLVARQAVRYSLVGTTGTAVYIGLYLLLDLWTQPMIGNAVAWLATTLATNSSQRRFAFASGSRKARPHRPGGGPGL